MSAIDVGVGHDDDPFVAKGLLRPFVFDAATQRLLQVGDFLIGANLVGRGGCDI